MDIQIGGCQNDEPVLGTLNIRCRIILGLQKGTIVLTTTQMTIIWNMTCKLGGGGVVMYIGTD